MLQHLNGIGIHITYTSWQHLILNISQVGDKLQQSTKKNRKRAGDCMMIEGRMLHLRFFARAKESQSKILQGASLTCLLPSLLLAPPNT